ncbi:cation:proton antiporter [Propioniciclava flava]
MNFAANRRPIILLSVGLVVVTTFAVGAVVNWLIPGLGWAAALAIGAVVAPPDAVAATAIGRRIGLPRRVVTVLEGESLLNDASALVALRTAIAALAGAVTLGQISFHFLLAAGGGTLAGFVMFMIVARLRRRITNPVIDTTISLITPYAAYMLAEAVHASGVIAVVVAGLLLAHKAPVIQTAPSRIAERTTWNAISFLLENTVFLLIGLQTNWIIHDVLASHLPLGWIVLVCGSVLVTVIVVRLVWVFAMRVPLMLNHRKNAGGGAAALLVGWAGMRGVVTLAAAFILPSDVPYPGSPPLDCADRRGRDPVPARPDLAVVDAAPRHRGPRSRLGRPHARRRAAGGRSGRPRTPRHPRHRRPPPRRRHDPHAHQRTLIRRVGTPRHQRRPPVPLRDVWLHSADHADRRTREGPRHPQNRHGSRGHHR